MGLLAKLTGTTGKSTKLSERDPEASKKGYRGVQVVAGDAECCQAARDIAEMRFLSNEAPILPLKECDVAACACTYKHYGDRRTEPRRASDVGYDIKSQYCDNNNRSTEQSGRREDD